MAGRHSWEGTATELLAELGGAAKSRETLCRWLEKAENVQLLKVIDVEISKTRSETIDHARLIRIDRICAQ